MEPTVDIISEYGRYFESGEALAEAIGILRIPECGGSYEAELNKHSKFRKMVFCSIYT